MSGADVRVHEAANSVGVMGVKEGVVDRVAVIVAAAGRENGQ